MARYKYSSMSAFSLTPISGTAANLLCELSDVTLTDTVPFVEGKGACDFWSKEDPVDGRNIRVEATLFLSPVSTNILLQNGSRQALSLVVGTGAGNISYTGEFNVKECSLSGTNGDLWKYTLSLGSFDEITIVRGAGS